MPKAADERVNVVDKKLVVLAAAQCQIGAQVAAFQETVDIFYLGLDKFRYYQGYGGGKVPDQNRRGTGLRVLDKRTFTVTCGDAVTVYVNLERAISAA